MSESFKQLSADNYDQDIEPGHSLATVISAAVLSLIFIVTSTVWISSVLYTVWQTPTLRPSFDQGVTKPLKSAAHAGSLATAKVNIRAALDFVRTDPQIQTQLKDSSADTQEFQAWVHNLEETQRSLEQVRQDASISEQAITLDWVRAVLTQPDWLGGESVITPILLPGSFKFTFHPLLLVLMLTSSLGFSYFLVQRMRDKYFG